MTHERFRIYWVDAASQLFRFFQSDRMFHDACLILDIAKSTLGPEHWIIIDGRTEKVVRDTRPGQPSLVEDVDEHVDSGELAPAPATNPTVPATHEAAKRVRRRRPVESID